MTKTIEIKVAMDGMPDGADAGAVASEVRAMLLREYADGVTVNASVLAEKRAQLVEIDPSSIKSGPDEDEEEKAQKPASLDEAVADEKSLKLSAKGGKRG